MQFTKAQAHNYYMDDTAIPNIFIAEFLPSAPGDYVKVYLYAYMQTCAGIFLSNSSIAQALGLSPEDVLKAWTWFEEHHVIRKRNTDPNDPLRYDVEFTDLKGRTFGDAEPAGRRRASSLDNARVRAMFEQIEQVMGRMIPPTDVQKIQRILDDGASPELFAYAYTYCAERGKRLSAAYAGGVVRRWMEAGIETPEQAKARVYEEDQRYADYRSVLKALGHRTELVTDGEKKIIDAWIDQYGYTIDQLLELAERAATKRNKFDYVKAIIENEYARAHEGSQPTDGQGSPS
ncbi:MAG: DnaD domain protein, partial [Clostridiales Family XIII bacterium]|nr:DnaD domain protein [Clostridiales Family XIII bacterium]